MKFDKGSKQETRRKLIRGSIAAAPLLLTLRSGSAAAATSLICTEKLAGRTFPGWQNEENEDEAFRMPVEIYTVTVDGKQIEAYKIDGRYFEKNSGTELIDLANPGLEPISGPQLDYALVYVDPNGNQTVHPDVSLGGLCAPDNVLLDLSVDRSSVAVKLKLAHASGATWRMAPRSSVLVRQLDEELLLFDSLTWRTHLLTRTAAEVVRLIGDHACSLDDLTEPVAPGDATFRNEVQSLLRQLGDLGLIERVDN